LNRKVAIVTGSTSGIGLGIAKRFASEGCCVVFTGTRSEEEGLKMMEKLKLQFHNPNLVYVRADFGSNPEEICKTIISTALKSFGTIDILVNNAGVQYVAPVDSFPSEVWRRVIDINLNASFYLIQLVLPIMKKNPNRWGRILNISSVHGIVASSNKSAYVASKHALNGLTKVVALENAHDTKITCNAICPGWVLTPLVQRQIEERAKLKSISISDATTELLMEKQPSGRFTTVEEISDLVLFLCSEATNNITGTQQVIDGGWTVQ